MKYENLSTPWTARILGVSLALPLLAALGCGDDGGEPGPMDAGPMDDQPPELVSTNPLDNERGVTPETVFLLQFDEPMNTAAGSLTVNPGGEILAVASGDWFENDTRFSARPSSPLEQGVDYEVVISGFQDASGNVADDVTLEFQTLDEEAPTIVSSTPTQGATDLSARLTQIEVVFSEPMDQGDGDVDLQGGPRTIGPGEWLDDRTIRWEVAGLAYERTYELFMFGFRDTFGNFYDDTVFVDEGVLRFSTGVDDEAPFVSGSSPMEGAMGVNPSRTTATFTFVEPMDTSVRGGLLSIDAGEGVQLDGRWSGDGTRLTFEFAPLGQERDLRIDLTGQGHADAVGNALDVSTYLGDGALDFSTGLDVFPPTVVASSLDDGATDVGASDVAVITITFNEAMDTAITNLTAIEAESGETFDLPITWIEDDRAAAIDGSALVGGFTYTIDVTVLTDTAGNPVDSNAFGDGVLDFTTAPPTGESCADPLNVGQATLADGVYTWSLADGAASDVDGGGETCDSTPGRDIVIAYEKTTDSLSEGGTLLSVSVDSTDDANLEVSTGICDPEDPTFASLACADNVEEAELVLDVGPGTYYIYVSHNLSTSTFPAMEVLVRETDEFPEGEGCGNPYDDTSAIYTAPAMAGDPHVWDIPESAVSTYDRTADSSSDPSCGPDTSSVGPDAAIVFDKVSASSVLEVTVENMAVSTLDDLIVTASTTCDAAVTEDVVGCIAEVDGGADVLAVSAPAGPVYIWLLRDDSDFFPETRVSIREVTVSEGEACSNPKVISGTGATSVTLDSTQRFGAPGCFPETGSITWYSYTAPASGYVRFAPTGGGAIALVDGANVVCSNEGLPVTPAVFANGQEVCIAVANDASITSLEVTELAYTGLAGTVTDPMFMRALSSTGSEVSWTGADSMTVTPTTLYMGSTATLFSMDKDGGERAVEITELGTGELGYSLVAVGESVFSLENTFTDTATHVYRLWDAFSFPWDPEDWDTPPSGGYDDDTSAMTYDGASFVFATAETENASFYSLGSARPGDALRIGVANSTIEDVVSIAADDTWIYFIGQADLTGQPDEVEGLFRIRRADLTASTNEPEPLLVEYTSSTVTPRGNLPAMSSYGTTQGPPMYLDDREDPSYLYFRTMNPNQVHVIADPAGAAPLYLGTIVELGDSGDYPMAYDYGTGSLYLFESDTTSDGRIVKID